MVILHKPIKAYDDQSSEKHFKFTFLIKHNNNNGITAKKTLTIAKVIGS